jgi:acyl-CoA reductase-like NAD-dependent aldehyde dehydrogenase
MFVDGAWTGSLSGETFTADSPATGESIGEVPQGTRDDARLAIGAANRAWGAQPRCTASPTRSRSGATTSRAR